MTIRYFFIAEIAKKKNKKTPPQSASKTSSWRWQIQRLLHQVPKMTVHAKNFITLPNGVTMKIVFLVFIDICATESEFSIIYIKSYLSGDLYTKYQIPTKTGLDLR